MTHKALGYLAMAAVLVCAGVFLLYHLGVEPLQDYDEATYAEIVHEALVSHDFLSFTYGGGDYFKKPPLMFWSMGVSETLLGENTFAMRLPFALAGVALIGVVMLTVYEISKSTWAAALAGAVAATTSPLMETARQVRMDVPVVLCIIAAFYFFLRGLKNERWFLLFGLMVGLAVLAKSVIAVFAGVAALGVIIAYRRFDVLRDKYFWGSVGIFFLVAAPWHLYETVRFGLPFWQQYIGFEVIMRAQENIFWTVTITNSDYVHYLFQFAQPWIWVFFAALAWLMVRWKHLDTNIRACALAAVAALISMIAVFFLAGTKAPTYLMPLYPFAAVIIGLTAATFASMPRLVRILFACAALGLVAWAASFTIYNAYHHNPYYSTYLALAHDEEVIGQTLAKTPSNQPFYVYDDENLGSIIYYSQHLHPLALPQGAPLAPGSLLVVDSSGVALVPQTFPKLTVKTLYGGSQVTLLEALN